jgi:hypothetical protein
MRVDVAEEDALDQLLWLTGGIHQYDERGRPESTWAGGQ